MRRDRWTLGYLALALAWTWTCYAPASVLGEPLTVRAALYAVLGPTMAALVMVGSESGWGGLARFLRSAGWTAPARWVVGALLAPPCAWLVALLAWSHATGAALPQLDDVDWSDVPLAFLVIALTGPLWEEIGWRGYALPRLQESQPPWVASALVGVAWAVWHLPLFTLSGTAQEGGTWPVFLVFVIAASIVTGWFWNASGRRIAVVWALHASLDACHALLEEALPVMPQAACFDRMLAVGALAGAGAVLVATRFRLGVPLAASKGTTGPCHSPRGPASAPTGSSSRSARAAWPRSTRPTRPGSTASSR